MAVSNLARGTSVIANALPFLEEGPGCYQMFNKKGAPLYIGKAKNLKKRVASYTKPERNPLRIQRMIAETYKIDSIITRTEIEALLLEANLIKRLKPHYNILLRDDKSFPLILLRKNHDFPAIIRHRGQKTVSGDYFGPFASTRAVNVALVTLQKIFKLRNCSDAVFAQRKRPCLQYHIKRCSAPCVGRVSREIYMQQVTQAGDFLHGRDEKLRKQMANDMQKASEAHDFERAALLRDRLQALGHIRAEQDINLQKLPDADVVSLYQKAGISAIQVTFFRNSHHYGSRAFFPRHNKDETPEDVISAFIAQFYANKTPPKLLLLSHPPSHHEWLEEALSEKAGTRTRIEIPLRGVRHKAILNSALNAEKSLARYFAERKSEKKLLKTLAQKLALKGSITRIEIYDNSHFQGHHALGAMVVSGPEGFVKKAYRLFRIRTTEKGDDIAMMREVFKRRFTRLLNPGAQDDTSHIKPDLVIIDGGKTQLEAARTIFRELNFTPPPLLAMAKGVDRNAGRETFFRPGKPAFTLKEDDSLLYFLQRLRDEAHRFAIGAMRRRASNELRHSPLDLIEGVGRKRKMALLSYFGSARAVGGASLEDLCAVPGINRPLAERIQAILSEK